ncbi:MAG: thiamine phosphate synthase [Sarcina sp.]
MRFNERTLYLVTNQYESLNEKIDLIENNIKRGISIIQYNPSDKSMRDMLHEANMIKEICRKHRILFLVRDRLDLAMAVNADGVHLSIDDIRADIARSLIGDNKIIGLSVNSLEALNEAENFKVDYILVQREEFFDIDEIKKGYKGNIYYKKELIQEINADNEITGILVHIKDISLEGIDSDIKKYI